MKYELYQMKEEFLSEFGFRPYNPDSIIPKEYYHVTYSGETKENDVNTALNGLFLLFNINHPQDFKSYSMSVGDVVKINGEWYYCNTMGWVIINTW